MCMLEIKFDYAIMREQEAFPKQDTTVSERTKVSEPMMEEAENTDEMLNGVQKVQAPLLRIYLFGDFQIAWQVMPFTEEELWSSRTSARSLFKLLLCAPGRQAPKSLLAGILWPNTDEEKALESLRSASKVLGKVLRTANGESLLEQRDRRNILKLADQTRLWVDADAFENLIYRASRAPASNESPVLWQQAKNLLRGEFLADDQSQEWANYRWVKIRRHTLWMARCRMIRHLADCYLQQGQVTLAEEMLEQHIARFPTDQDSLYRLLLLLAQQQYFEEACILYERTRHTLEIAGKQPTKRLRTYYEYLRKADSSQKPSDTQTTNTPVDRSHQVLFPVSSSEPIQPSQHLYSAMEQSDIRADQLLFDLSSLTLSHGIVKGENQEPQEQFTLFTNTQTNPSDLFNLSSASSLLDLSSSLFGADIDVLSNLSFILDMSSSIGEKEATYLDRQTRLYWHARELSVLPANILYAYVIRHMKDIALFLARSPLLGIRPYLCEIACRTTLLAGILLYDMGQYEKARKHYHVAFKAASEANNVVLQALVWGWVSFTWTYLKHYTDALRCVQQASYFAKQSPDIIIQAWLGAIEAEIQAHLQSRDACLQSLTHMERAFGMSPSEDISYLFEFNPVLLLGYKGVCLQQLYQRQKPETHYFLQEAREALEQALESDAPTKRKLYYLSDLAGVYARQGDVEKACSYLTQTVPLILRIGSCSKTIHQHLLQSRTLLQPYEQSSHVQTLDEQMRPLLVLKHK